MLRYKTGMSFLLEALGVFHQRGIRSLKPNNPDILCKRSVKKTYPKKPFFTSL